MSFTIASVSHRTPAAAPAAASAAAPAAASAAASAAVLAPARPPAPAPAKRPVLTHPSWRVALQIPGKRAAWLSIDVKYRAVLGLKRGTQIRLFFRFGVLFAGQCC